MTVEQAKEKYINLCEKAAEKKTQVDYSYAVGVAQGFIKAVADFIGPKVAKAIVDHAEKLNKTVMGIPTFNSKTLEHA